MTVSVLVPFTPEPSEIGKQRARNWSWLHRRWRQLLPDAEIVVGQDHGRPFSKSTAVNDAYSRSSGDILVVADADSWVSVSRVAVAVEYAARVGVMVVPWSKAHRLSPQDTARLLREPPETLQPITSAMRRQAEPFRPSPATAGMIFVVTREGFERCGGMDPRFRGWGAEDVCFGLACDTLLGKKKILLGDAYALHHTRSRVGGARVWDGDDGHHNVELAERYWAADGNPQEMSRLCGEHPLDGSVTPIQPRPEAASRPVERSRPGRPSTDGVVREFLVGGMRRGDSVVL